MWVKAAIMALAITSSTSAFACRFDRDCDRGSACEVSLGQIYGVCVGGSSPGNRYDNQPIYSPRDSSRTYGNTCFRDVDCGRGLVCSIDDGARQGVCVQDN